MLRYSFIHALYLAHFGFVLLNKGTSDEAGLEGISCIDCSCDDGANRKKGGEEGEEEEESLITHERL